MILNRDDLLTVRDNEPGLWLAIALKNYSIKQSVGNYQAIGIKLMD